MLHYVATQTLPIMSDIPAPVKTTIVTSIRMFNFKSFDQVEIPLSAMTVLQGQNNSGKTSVLEGLLLWRSGIAAWQAAHRTKKPSTLLNPKLAGGVLNLQAHHPWHLPPYVKASADLWRDGNTGQNIEIVVSGRSSGDDWELGMEFYKPSKSVSVLYARPMLDSNGMRMAVPEQLSELRMATIPYIAGIPGEEYLLPAEEFKGMMRTGSPGAVFRNFMIDMILDDNGEQNWEMLAAKTKEKLGIRLHPPRWHLERHPVTMEYVNEQGTMLEVGCLGAGSIKVIFLLACTIRWQGRMLLLEEPCAHEFLGGSFSNAKWIKSEAVDRGSQVVAVSHSARFAEDAANVGATVVDLDTQLGDNITTGTASVADLL